MAKKSFAVIGLNAFGLGVVEELVENNQDVICIDKNEDAVRKVSSIVPTSFVADATDEKALLEIGVQDCDSVIVSFSSNKEAAVLCTVILKQMGVNHIVVKMDDDYYIPIMKRLGADEVISPQKSMGRALANRIGTEDYIDYYKLNEDFAVVSILVRDDYSPTFLKDLNSNEKFGINIVLITRGIRSFVPTGNDEICPGDTLFVVGNAKGIRAFRKSVNK